MNVRILLIDDSKATRRVLSAIVNSRWNVCGLAENGELGVKKFRELKPDVVLLDLAMPDIDGFEAARQMKAIDPSVPIIAFTLLDPWGLESAARKVGICRVVSKSEGWRLVESIEDIVSELEGSGRLKSQSRGGAEAQTSKAGTR
jgi:two-component system, chemotaxis family, chemotaxis protein CheY